jgi:diguanylate cyclase (GGDEF)-like protein
VVHDLSADDRFKNNPLVINSPWVRFYTGAAVIDDNGLALGTIAVLDSVPRTITHQQRQGMIDLATITLGAIQARRHSLELKRQHLTDFLTGVGSRECYEKALQVEVRQSRRNGEHFAVLMMDLDGFKSVNDTFGHPAGDFVLCEVSKRIASILRAGDILARLGGDEFAIVMRQADSAAATALTDRITEAVREPITLPDGQAIVIGISVGTAVHSGSNDSAEALLAQADEALYARKRARPQSKTVRCC